MNKKVKQLESLTLSALLTGLTMIFFQFVKVLVLDLPIILLFMSIATFFYCSICSLKSIHYFLIPVVLSSTFMLNIYLFPMIIILSIFCALNAIAYFKMNNIILFVFTYLLSFIIIEIIDISYNFAIYGLNQIDEYKNIIDKKILELEEKYESQKVLIRILKVFSEVIIYGLILLYPVTAWLLGIALVFPLTRKQIISKVKIQRTFVTLFVLQTLFLLGTIGFIAFYNRTTFVFHIILLIPTILYFIISIISSLLIPITILSKGKQKFIVAFSFTFSLILSPLISIPILLYSTLKTKNIDTNTIQKNLVI